ncbi:MAG: biotin synthase BioB, partial [Desulfobacterales bacterium]|nr:biotin synthase BioB [Desulfobacterales bacterium]
TIAIFRLITGNRTIRIAAGRESVLKDFQGLAFMAGADGMIIGGYLTVKGRSPEEDLGMVSEIRKLWNG